ncbi:MAG: hypothetical protein ABWU84_09530 [Pyrobaculum sp.]
MSGDLVRALLLALAAALALAVAFFSSNWEASQPGAGGGVAG